jgi:hypothetical protein
VRTALGEEKSIVSGPVVYPEEHGFMSNFFRLDFLGLMAVTEADIKSGRPTMANGTNLLYKTELRREMSAAEMRMDIPSGDDVFLLHAAKERYGSEGIGFSTSAIVTTEPPSSFSDFLNQRMRWGGKAKHYKDVHTLRLAILVWSTSLALLILPFVNIYFSLLAWSLKGGLDYWVLSSSAHRYGQGISLFHFMGSLLIYPFYITAVGGLSQLNLATWK